MQRGFLCNVEGGFKLAKVERYSKQVEVRNVADRKDPNGFWLKSFAPEPNTKHTTRAAIVWMNMNSRCKTPYKEECPTYQGCSVGFKDFQSFAEWCQSQEGYGVKDGERFWSLDKDLLFEDNKVYSEATCIFVPYDVNSTLAHRNTTDLPCGVQIYPHDSSRFVAACKLNGKSHHLGVFDSADLAHKAWQEKKIEAIQFLCGKYTNYPVLHAALVAWLERFKQKVASGAIIY